MDVGELLLWHQDWLHGGSRLPGDLGPCTVLAVMDHFVISLFTQDHTTLSPMILLIALVPENVSS